VGGGVLGVVWCGVETRTGREEPKGETSVDWTKESVVSREGPGEKFNSLGGGGDWGVKQEKTEGGKGKGEEQQKTGVMPFRVQSRGHKAHRSVEKKKVGGGGGGGGHS